MASLFDEIPDPQNPYGPYGYWLPKPDMNPVAPAGIESESDVVRLNNQQQAVWSVLKDGKWYTLPELVTLTGFPAQSISARIRDLRKRKYGGHRVDRESLGNGLYRYRLRAG